MEYELELYGTYNTVYKRDPTSSKACSDSTPVLTGTVVYGYGTYHSQVPYILYILYTVLVEKPHWRYRCDETAFATAAHVYCVVDQYPHRYMYIHGSMYGRCDGEAKGGRIGEGSGTVVESIVGLSNLSVSSLYPM